MTTATLPATLTLGAVHLTVADAPRVAEFYTSRLGLAPRGTEGAVTRLGAGERDLVVLHHEPSARRARGTTGLFHLAILVPSRDRLGAALAHLLETRTRLSGVADHGVSEALYLSDPEGNGIEIYRDRPREEWPFRDGALQMVTDPLDTDGVLAERAPAPAGAYALDPGTVMGHVHLHVSHLDPAERFHREVLGFDVMQRWGDSARFLSAGGYHHHLGLNTWAGVGAPPPPPGATGLRWWEVHVPEAAVVDGIAARAEAAGLGYERVPGGVRLADPSGNAVAVLAP
jgi:catechol 2,3-dioxygenase